MTIRQEQPAPGLEKDSSIESNYFPKLHRFSSMTSFGIVSIFFVAVQLGLELPSYTVSTKSSMIIDDAPPVISPTNEKDDHLFRRNEQQNNSSRSIAAGTAVSVDNSKLASNILNGKSTFPPDIAELKFVPGTLQLEAIETLGYCYTDVDVYQKHFRVGHTASWSHKHQMVYLLVPKSGSSTGRSMMKTRFDATEEKEIPHSNFGREDFSNYTFFTFVRDPLSRFFSSYDETFSRSGPWRTNWNRTSHPVPYYLHAGMKTYEDYERIYCPPETRLDIKQRRECHDRPTMENGTLAARLERFVKEWDGLSPLDEHLKLQVPILSDRQSGLSFHIDEIYNTTAGKEGWEHLAYVKNVNLSIPIQIKRGGEANVGVIGARSAPRRFDVKRIGDETKQRICELALIDYCCLNLPLPPPCENLYCKLNYGEEDEKRNNKSGGEAEKKRRLQIQPWTFPTSQPEVETTATTRQKVAVAMNSNVHARKL